MSKLFSLFKPKQNSLLVYENEHVSIQSSIKNTQQQF